MKFLEIMKKNQIYLLSLILLLAFLVRIPGVFWGYHVFGEENIGFNPDEAIAWVSLSFTNFKTIDVISNYVYGFPFQVALLAFPLKLFMDPSLAILIGIGRLVSLMYGLLTIILIYFIASKIFNKKTGLFAALLLALSGLHVIFSHIGKPDSSNVFWIYFVFFFSYMYVKDKRLIYIILASIGAGFAAGIKFSVIQMISLIYIFFKSKKKITNLFLIIFIVAGSFALVNGFSYGFDNFLDSINFISCNFNDREYNRLLNIPLNTTYLFVGMGFAASLLFLYSTIILFKHNRLDKDFFYLFVLPILLYIIPLLIIIAAYGLYNINCKLNKKIFGVILLFVIIYQFSYVFSSESNYINDTRGKMGEWMLEHIDLNSKIYIGDPDNKYLVGGEFEITNKSKVSKNRAINRQGMVIPSEFTTVADFNDADYIVINMPLKYLRSYKNILRDPICCKEVQNCIYNECIFTQNL